jgi:hypothetical protein
MRRGFVFATWTTFGLIGLVGLPGASPAGQPPAAAPTAPKLQPLPAVATPPAVVHPSPYHPPTVVPGPVVVPGPAVVPVLGPVVSITYSSGLISPYNPLHGPPYAMPVFPQPATGPAPTGVRPTVSVTFAAGRTSQLSITAPAGQTFPANVRVQSVTDAAHSISWEVKSVSVSPDRRTLNVTVEGKGLPKTAGKPPESGSLTVTLAGTGTLPTVQPVPVVYVTPQ